MGAGIVLCDPHRAVIKGPSRLRAQKGIDGTGKTTQINRLENCLKSEGHDVICTFEPGASSIGKEVRAFILDSRYDIAPLTETLLLCADRYEHQQNIIIPALKAGKTVLADRTQDSTVAYQAFGKGVDLKLIEDFDRQYLIRPDITFYLDIESGKTAGRIDRRLQSAGEQNKFDIYATDFLTASGAATVIFVSVFRSVFG
ncbi:hypothetical protein CHS0354_035373 [Potamilus streckersoni]|uniref:dTMP kinase n=1 Tax=Potamilus streckersoni TaxID=2493646 RepID=A0AAE0S2W8_9BIVA|nr:hypothetical protein CHS0354_035373 [Potamilus streckersoni]